MSNATPESISNALSVIGSRPSPDFCYATRDSVTGEPCIYSLYWHGSDRGAGNVSIYLQCKSPSKTALVHTTRVLWLGLDDIFIDDKPIGSGGEFRIAFPEPSADKVLDQEGHPAAIDMLVDALNAALTVPIHIG